MVRSGTMPAGSTASGVPPVAGTRSSPPMPPITIRSSSPQLPRSAGMFSASVTGAPPRTGAFFNVQRYWMRSDGPGGPRTEKNPTQAPSGEKNGSSAPSVPANGWASASSRRRSTNCRVWPSLARLT